MIFEQAFIALPEFLVGTGFTRYQAEGTLVMAYAMSVLQELNGRNVNNPISLVNGETAYPNTHNRAVDLHLNYSPVGSLNANLAAFGVRSECWLEAKFFRKKDGAPTLDSTKGAYALLRDILRLCVFPPEQVGAQPKSSRFLLHVYEGVHTEHLAMDRNIGDGGGRAPRSWLTRLHSPGTASVQVADLNAEPAGFDNEVGNQLRSIDLTVALSNQVLFGATAAYSLYLTRIDSFKLVHNGRSIELGAQLAQESSAGVWDGFRADLDTWLQK